LEKKAGKGNALPDLLSSCHGLTMASIPSRCQDARLRLHVRFEERRHALLRCDQRSFAPVVGASARYCEQFTARYGVKRLVWYEEFPWMIDAIKREKAIKTWPRKWKIELIEKTNPDWRDLSSHLVMF
jgi:hypothetical protein